MKLDIDGKSMYCDGLFFCYVEAGNGRTDLPNGAFPVATTYSHKFGKDLPNVTGIGWIGTHPECDVILGRVRKGNGVVPCESHLVRILAMLETAEDRGAKTTLVIA